MNQNEPDFWNHHSLHYLEMAFETNNRESIESPDGYGQRTGVCGDSVEFFIMVDKGILTRISFDVQGCLNTIACCNTVIRLTQGKPIEETWDILPDHVADFLETLPPDHLHCAELAVGGFYLALSDYRKKENV
jgi:nitrogen fixation NifU-like protein